MWGQGMVEKNKVVWNGGKKLKQDLFKTGFNIAERTGLYTQVFVLWLQKRCYNYSKQHQILIEENKL